MSKKAAPTNTEFSQDIITALKHAIHQAGISAKTLAPQAGMSVDYIYTRLRGERPLTVTDLDHICNALNINVYDLLNDAAHISNPDAPTISQNKRTTIANQLRQIANQLEPDTTSTAQSIEPSDEERKTTILNQLRNNMSIAANHDDNRDKEIEHGSERY